MTISKKNNELDVARRVLQCEINGLQALIAELDGTFLKAIDLLYSLKGRVVVSGMGKSGHIARKIAATLASTGTPALFVHPGEASHGDLGMITQSDAVILLSNSGETAELTDIINFTRRFSIPLIAIVRRKTSTLVDAADIAFILPEIPEAAPSNALAIEAPTTSTTMMLAWGDALAISLLEKRGFSAEDFHLLHPGGKLGSNLIKIKQLMKKMDELPLVKKTDLMSDALIVMTAKRLGCAAVIDKNNKPIGIITDGDLRRHMSIDLTSKTVAEIMTKDPITISPNALAVEALACMNKRSVTCLFVADDSKSLVGIIHIHDILNAGVS